MSLRIPTILNHLTGRCLVAASCLLFLWGCASSPDENYLVKEPRIFRRTWFDFYNRARWLLQEGRFEEAETDFRQALLRHDAESWDERTYGVHFVEYFPHRELGIVLYSLGRYEDAESEFVKSLQMEDSSRAKFYLNRVRRTLIEVSGKDHEAPTLHLDKAYEGMVIGELSFDIVGWAEDDTFVSAVRIAGEPVYCELWSPRLKFTQSVSLQSGANDVEIVVEDISGKKTRRTVQILVDRQAPLLLVHETRAEGNQIRIKVGIEDIGGLKSAKIGEHELSFNGETHHLFEDELPWDQDSDGIPFVIEDQIGNDLRGTLEIEHDREAALPRKPDYLSWVGDGDPVDLFRPGQLLAFDPWIAQRNTPEGSSPPVITIPSIDETHSTVFLDRYYIEGRIVGEEEIDSLQINGLELMRSKAKEVYFGRVVELKSATNEFMITARDRLNRESSKRLRVIRVIPEMLSIGTRLALTLSPLEYLGEEGTGLQELSERLLQVFVRARRFRVLDRDSFEAIMLERKLGASELADPSTSAHLGRLQQADLVLCGYVRPYPRTQGLEVVGRLVDTESAEVLFEHDVYGEQQEAFSLTQMLEGLYLKLARGFPLLQGPVMAVERRELSVDLDYGTLARSRMQFVIYREGEPLIHPVTGRVLGTKTEILGKGRVDEVLERSAALSILELQSGARITPGDRVIAR